MGKKSYEESIMQKKRECYICGAQGDLAIHHVMHGFANRKKATADRLWVWMCTEHHRQLHDEGLYDDDLKAAGQVAWQRVYRKDEDAFISRYGKNYL